MFSLSDSWGEIKRAVGRGPPEEGPLPFFFESDPFNIEGGGTMEIFGVELYLSAPGRWICVLLEAPKPIWFNCSPVSILICPKQASITLVDVPSSRFAELVNGTKLFPSDMYVNKIDTVMDCSSRDRLPHIRHQKFSRRAAVGSRNAFLVVVYTAIYQIEFRWDSRFMRYLSKASVSPRDLPVMP